MQSPPLIIHAIHHLIMGGLENGLVNLINRMPADRYRHAILCIDYYSDFRNRIERDGVKVYAMHRKPGRDPATSYRIWKLFRAIRPDIVHSRNLSGLDALFPAFAAGVRCRIHSEHGWHDGDPDGSSRKYQILRRLHRPLVTQYVALSRDLNEYLVKRVGVAQGRVTQIQNGVDVERFHSRSTGRARLENGPEWRNDDRVVIGSVGRFQGIKDPMNLAQAFVRLLSDAPGLDRIVRLAMVGDGPEFEAVKTYLQSSGVARHCWLPGARDDVPEVLRSYDVFVLPSRGEGISNTILEAMASGLPVVATDVGGNAELLLDGDTGKLVPATDPVAMAEAIRRYAVDADLRLRHGSAGRRRSKEVFSLDVMTRNYLRLYDNALAR